MDTFFQKVCLDSKSTFCIYDTIFAYKKVMTHSFLEHAYKY